MKTQYFNVKEYDLEQVETLLQSYSQKSCSIGIFYPNYNLTNDELLRLNSIVPNKTNWDISLIENENFELNNEAISNLYCYNNINLYAIQKINKTFDIVVFTRIVEHLNIDEYLTFLYLLRNIINQNSKLVLTFPDMDIITKQIKQITNKRNMDISEYYLWNIEMFNSDGTTILDYHKMYTNPQLIKYLSQYESLFTVTDISEPFALATTRKCYRRAILEPITSDK